MKLLGKIFLVLFSLIFLVSAALWFFTKNIQPETIKRFVAQQITAITHKESQIDGAISWQFFPNPSLKIQNIQIGSAKRSDNYNAKINSLVFNVKLSNLLKGALLFDELAIDGLQLEVNTNTPKIISPLASQKNENKSVSHKEFAIQRVTITHSQVLINQNQEQTQLKNVQIAIEDFNLQRHSFPIQIKTRLSKLNNNTKIRASIAFTGRLNLDDAIINNLGKGTAIPSVEGQLLLQNITFNQIAINKINTTLNSNKDNLAFNPLTVSLYGGEAVGTMNYTFSNHQIAINQTATNLNGKELFNVLIGHPLLSGTMDYSIHANFPIDLFSLKSFVGKGQITLKDGKLYGVNMDEVLNQLKGKLTQLMSGNLNSIGSLDELNKSTLTQGDTEFKLANLDYQLKNELFSTNALIIQTDKLQVKGDGAINLNNHTMNSKLQVTINNNDESMQKIQSLVGGYFPLALSGTLEHPNISPDFKSIGPLVGQLLTNPNFKKPLKLLGKQIKGFIR
ncbi:AsmA family protein [Legionella sp. km772]|uniref:AsmA family protein n=1 Tax=Legionella sp. km772 TaxID=2498111 RepID=UPI000F8CCBCF|nr:AsmA family protein [Legionella sp. km772]RUR11969.1 AsmA family protein [Legionella sp. km772]